MFEGIVARAQRSADTLVSKYVTRLAVAVPFVIALGFGTAAASVRLTEEFGSLGAYTILASAFGVIGLVAAAAIALGSPKPHVAIVPHAADTPVETTTDDSMAVTPELVLTALGALGPAALPQLARLLLKNIPLVILALVLGYLLLSESRPSEGPVDGDPA
jgi:hypothetical protein